MSIILLCIGKRKNSLVASSTLTDLKEPLIDFPQFWTINQEPVMATLESYLIHQVQGCRSSPPAVSGRAEMAALQGCRTEQTQPCKENNKKQNKSVDLLQAFLFGVLSFSFIISITYVWQRWGHH